MPALPQLTCINTRAPGMVGAPYMQPTVVYTSGVMTTILPVAYLLIAAQCLVQCCWFHLLLALMTLLDL